MSANYTDQWEQESTGESYKEWLEERMYKLEQRLEIDPRHQTDGIEARDETIKGLEGVIAGLKAERLMSR